ncbi:MAG: hypothetical protein ACRD0K_26700 [Egibacteraceae bacterium]
MMDVLDGRRTRHVSSDQLLSRATAHLPHAMSANSRSELWKPSTVKGADDLVGGHQRSGTIGCHLGDDPDELTSSSGWSSSSWQK